MNDKYVKEKLVLKKEIRSSLSKLLSTIIVFLLGMIASRINPTFKSTLNKKVYVESINFHESRKLYSKYFNNLFIKDESPSSPVSSTKLQYNKESKYENGVLLTVSNNYPVPVLENGLIIFVDDSKIIIEQVDGVKTSYTNIKNNNHKLYDYLEKGEILGEVLSKELYLSFEKEGEYLDYKRFI